MWPFAAADAATQCPESSVPNPKFAPYSIHIRMLDGIDGGNTGVMMLQDGRIRGGDAYSGSYDGESAEGEATALAGKRSIRFKAVLRKLVEA